MEGGSPRGGIPQPSRRRASDDRARRSVRDDRSSQPHNCTLADRHTLPHRASASEFAAIIDSHAACDARAWVERDERANDAVVTHLCSAIHDAEVTDANVGGELGSAENHAGDAERDASVHSHIGMGDKRPSRITRRAHSRDDTPTRPRVIDRDREVRLPVVCPSVDRAEHRPPLWRRGIRAIIEESQKR